MTTVFVKTKYLILLTNLFSWLYWALAHETYEYSGENGRQLEYVQILSTNGIYTPIKYYANSKTKTDGWPGGVGALTKLGKLQQYELGNHLRGLYNNFITSSPVEVDAFSSAEDRSTQSTLCLLASLYAPTKEWEFLPGFHWQPIPVSYLDLNDYFFRFYENCPAQMKEKEQFYINSPGKEILEKDQFYYAYWRNHSESQLQNWNHVAELYDNLLKEKKFGMEFPEWANKYWNEMKRIADSAYSLNYQSKKSLRLKVGSLLSLITLRMRAKAVESDEIKVSVYMTHDWNMAAFLIAAGQFNGVRPPPCATVTIELFHHATDDQYSVRMQYFNSSSPESKFQKPHLLTLKNCTEFCPLNKYVDHFQDIILEDYLDYCYKV